MVEIQCFFSQTLHTAVAHEHSSVHQSLSHSTELSAPSQPNPAPGYYLLQTAESETIHLLHKRGSEIPGKPEYFKSQCKEKKALRFQPKGHGLLDVANYNLLIFLMLLHRCFPLMRHTLDCLYLSLE